MKLRTSILGDKRFFKLVLAIGLPTALQNLLVNASTMVDTIMVGTQGETALSAVGLSSQYASLFFSAFFGFCSAGIMFYSQYHGARDEKGITRAYGFVLSCMMVVGLIFGGAAVIAPDFILGIYTDKTEIIAAGRDYMRIMGFSLPLQGLSMGVSSLLRSTERVKAPLVASIFSQAVNLFVNWLLIFGKFGFPEMGAAGAAVGTLVSGIVNVLILYAYCIRAGVKPILQLRAQFHWTADFIRLYFRKALPIITNEVLYGVAQLLINMVMGRQEAEGIAALAIFRTVERLIFAFFSGFTNASAVIVGKQVGAGELKEGYRDMKRFAFLCPAITCLICVLILPLRGTILGLFGLHSGLSYDYGMYMLAFYILAGTLRTCNYIINDTFRAAGEGVYGTVAELLSIFIVTVPVVYITGIVLQLPYLAVFSLMFVDDIVRLPIMLRRMLSGKWIKPVTDAGQAALPGFLKSRDAHKAS